MNRWFALLASVLLFVTVVNPAGALAKEERTLKDESIYDLLVDRFFNGDGRNDENVDTQNKSAFNGGDFAGIVTKLDYIAEMGFTILSLGPIFSTETYDGSHVLDYGKLEPHFGTDEDFANLIEAAHDKNLSVIADFPYGDVSANHVWVKDGTFAGIPASNGTIDWDSSDANVKETLKKAVVSFAKTYDLDGIRLTKLGNFDTEYVNEVIAALKAAKPDMYVFSNESVEADFDAVPNVEKMEALKQSFVKYNPDSSPLSLFADKVETDLIQFDELTGQRFTYDIVEARMFPPTRWKLATAALFTLPGIPVVTYETEIAVNGKEAPESHPLANFNTDMELRDYIKDLNFLRNKSDTLRNGDFEMLHNENGFTVFKRSSDKETWIIALNNTTGTTSFEIPSDLIGENKKLRGVLNGDLVKESADGKFRIVMEREVAEVYIADEDKGFNIPYLIASILVYVLFLSFLFVLWRRGKKHGNEESK